MRIMTRTRRHADRKLEYLHATPLFSLLPTNELLVAARRLELLELPAGRVLQHPGLRCDNWWLVLRGEITLTDRGTIVDTIGPGECWGHAPLLRRDPAAVSAVTHVPVVACTADRANFVALLSAVPTLGIDLLIGGEQRLRPENRSVAA